MLIVGGVLALGLLMNWDGIQGSPAPPFSLRETYGHVTLDSYRGRPVLLVFWTTSCGICRHELPLLSRIAPEFHRKGVEILAINVGGAEEANDYLRSNNIGLRSAIDENGATGQAYHVRGVPKLVLVGGDGVIHRSHSGGMDAEDLLEWADAAARLR